MGSAAGTAVAASSTHAQQATPTPYHCVTTMFVDTAHAGSFLPKPGEPDVYELTMEGATAQTIYFSDQPDRIVGVLPTAEFLEALGLGFTPLNPPNAAIAAQTETGEDILVVELFDPRWDGAAQTLTYASAG